MDAVSQMDLVFVRTLLRLAFGLARESDANDSVQSGLFSRGNVSERDEPEPVGGCHEHLHPRVRVRPGESSSCSIPTCLSITWLAIKNKCTMVTIVKHLKKLKQRNRLFLLFLDRLL